MKNLILVFAIIFTAVSCSPTGSDVTPNSTPAANGMWNLKLMEYTFYNEDNSISDKRVSYDRATFKGCTEIMGITVYNDSLYSGNMSKSYLDKNLTVTLISKPIYCTDKTSPAYEYSPYYYCKGVANPSRITRYSEFTPTSDYRYWDYYTILNGELHLYKKQYGKTYPASKIYLRISEHIVYTKHIE